MLTNHGTGVALLCNKLVTNYILLASPQMVDSCQAAAGFRVGEITALVFTGALSLETGEPHMRTNKI